MTSVLELKSVSKQFNQKKVLDQIDFCLEKGQILGLIGPSGSGKSTLIRIALGMEKPDSGQSKILGQVMPNRQVLGQIGYMAQSDALYESLTARENLIFFGQMKGLKRGKLKQSIDYVSVITGLAQDLDRVVSGYSGGMKRRLSLSIALLGDPELLILDEPTVGIDPLLRRQIWKELHILEENGRAILVTTHVMDEAEKTDKVALLLDGKIIANDSPEALKSHYQVANIEEVFLTAEGE